jgi:hypothetical protein
MGENIRSLGKFKVAGEEYEVELNKPPTGYGEHPKAVESRRAVSWV